MSFGVRVECSVCKRLVGVFPGGYVRPHLNRTHKLGDGYYTRCEGTGVRVLL